ncbi:MAG: Fe-S biogenesis protein NfuA [Pseudomonadota bacterium]|jgi:Fe/S biogenesis protein NfuA|nr:Fe-S biogenesis protein NfuA [Pseudomonadota bacterium]GIT23263.1 MAG: Fe/S biogenesis protein NfuA [Gammaproteobacteria bacterium]
MASITDSAQEYLVELLEKQNVEGIAVRIFILDAGTPRAETCISFCRPGEEKADDEVKQYKGFNAFIDQHSIPFLEDAVVDFQKDSMGGQLTIKAPNSRMPKLTKDSPLEDHINYILYNEINPGLAAHGGHVTLEEIFEDSVAVLRFGGGCQGCGMVDVTLKDGVEKTLMSQIPQLTEVRDVTDHSIKENAYYQ